MKMKVYVGTNGCIEGKQSSTIVQRFFKDNQSTIVKELTEADMIIFWACGLTVAREEDSLMLIKRIQAKMKPQTKLIVWGCLPKINPLALSKIYSGPLVGPRDFDFFERILGKRIPDFYGTNIGGSEKAFVAKENSGLPTNNQSSFLTSGILFFKKNWDGLCTHAGKKTKYWINIASGCTGHCTYCSERCAFGKIKSRPVESIISNIELGIRQGYTSFSIFATDVGAYGRDIGCNLADLLEEIIHIEAKRSFKLILNQVNPFYLKEMAPRLEKIFESGKIAAFDCPVQSGSDRLLKLMGRPYTANEWREYMVRISTRFPDIRLSTHFMVGFPTESDQDFRATMRLLDYPLFLDKMTIFRFSARPSVSASRISNQISEEIKKSRSKQLYQKYAYMYLLNSSTKWTHKILLKTSLQNK
jgi:threonylcarbamoyladenosine tRNA methylthiotransferase CDKAL1